MYNADVMTHKTPIKKCSINRRLVWISKQFWLAFYWTWN